jgi:hypothetical protein
MPWEGTTGTSGTAAMDILSRVSGPVIVPVFWGMCSCPVTRDGASVQFYIGTVIEYFRKIFQNINFVVGRRFWSSIETWKKGSKRREP